MSSQIPLGRGRLYKRDKTSPQKPDASGMVVDTEGRKLSVAVWFKHNKPMPISLRPWLDNEKPEEDRKPECAETKGYLHPNKRKRGDNASGRLPDYHHKVASPYGGDLFITVWDDNRHYMSVAVKPFKEK